VYTIQVSWVAQNRKDNLRAEHCRELPPTYLPPLWGGHGVEKKEQRYQTGRAQTPTQLPQTDLESTLLCVLISLSQATS